VSEEEKKDDFFEDLEYESDDDGEYEEDLEVTDEVTEEEPAEEWTDK